MARAIDEVGKECVGTVGKWRGRRSGGEERRRRQPEATVIG